jgi:predicted nucleotidyltransferase
MTKEEGQSPVVMNSFQHLIRFFLPLADTSFIPVHRTGLSGALLINVRDKFSDFNV